MNEDERCAYVQIVGQVLIADGILADAEREYLDRVMDQLEMNEDERKKALGGIDLDSPVEDRVKVLSPESKTRLIEVVREASAVEGGAVGAKPMVVQKIEELLAG